MSFGGGLPVNAGINLVLMIVSRGNIYVNGFTCPLPRGPSKSRNGETRNGKREMGNGKRETGNENE